MRADKQILAVKTNARLVTEKLINKILKKADKRNIHPTDL